MNASAIKQLIFIAIIILIMMLFFTVFAYQDFIVQNALAILVLLIFLFLIYKFDFIILMKDYERAVIFRFGKINRVGGPGWAVILPPIESHRRVDLRAHTIDIPHQDVVTGDNIEVRIDAVIYLRVDKAPQSVINSVVEIRDYEKASNLYVIALIRNIAGSMTLQELISNIDQMNETMKKKLERITKGWGVICDSVEIKDVQIPKTIIDAMHLEKAAEQEKLARIEKAKAHQAEIDAVKQAAGELSDKALSYYYIRAIEKLGEGKATKIIFPMEVSKLASAISGQVSGQSSGESIEALVKKYAPLIAEFMKAEKNEREIKEKPKDKNNKK